MVFPRWLFRIGFASHQSVAPAVGQAGVPLAISSMKLERSPEDLNGTINTQIPTIQAMNALKKSEVLAA